jgi:hypothetical protein
MAWLNPVHVLLMKQCCALQDNRSRKVSLNAESLVLANPELYSAVQQAGNAVQCWLVM